MGFHETPLWKAFPYTITQPNLMILVSFSSAEGALFNDVKNITLLARKVLKIRRSAFLGTPGMVSHYGHARA